MSPGEDVQPADTLPEEVGEDTSDQESRFFECIFDEDCEGELRLCVNGLCVDGCREDAQCDDGNACTTNRCTNSRCEATLLDEDLPDDIPGDCQRPACVAGVRAYVPLASDTPPVVGQPACVEARCVGTSPVFVPNHDLCDDGVAATGVGFCVPGEGCAVGELPPWVCPPFDPGYLPQEVCGNGQDDDGNGLVDEGCACEFGSVQRCFAGPPNARGVGQCRDGYQQCVNRARPRWGPCQGGILPSQEVCDGRDNACNGCVDDLPACDAALQCPASETVSPFRNYTLDATPIFGEEVTDLRWSVLAPPNSNTPGPEDASALRTQVFLDVSGDYQVSVSFTDDKGEQRACSWIVSAQGVGVRAELRWDTFGEVDLDLHMHRSGVTTGFCTSDDCYYANCRRDFGTGGINWGYPASPGPTCGRSEQAVCGNPRLDIDNVRGFDPENINLDNPRDGDRFRYMVHMFSGSRVTRPVLSLFCGGGLAAVIGEAPDEIVMTRSGSGCMGHTWRAADVTTFVDAQTGTTTCVVDILSNSAGQYDLRVNDSSY